jgi:uncharacterized protein YqeY
MRMATNLEATLREQLTAAIKARDLKTANLIRMINTKIMERRTAKDFTGTVDDALVTDVIRAYKKQMEKARGEFAVAGDRAKDQIAEIDFELEWCAKLLPQGASEAELRDAIATEVAKLQTKDAKQVGRVIGAVKKQFGDRADGATVKRLAEEALK